MKKTTFLLNLDMDLRKKLERLAKRKKISLTGLMRMALAEWTEQTQLKDKLERDIDKGKK